MPAAWLLDVSRLATRLGRTRLTGIDRVELAWCRYLLSLDTPCQGLVRTRPGYLLLGREGLEILAETAQAASANGGGTAVIGRLRRAATARCLRVTLGWMLAAGVPAGVCYLNLGHSNITGRVMRALSRVPESKIHILLHDAIPLSHPAFQTKRSVVRMRRVLDVAARHADGLIFPSAAAREAVLAFLPPGFATPTMVAHLGPGLASPGEADPADPPYFVMLGTVEPRKNHALIFDLWENMAADPPAVGVPKLKIVGQRGWVSPEILARLEWLRAQGRVEEAGPLPDAEVARILARSSGLLFPSIVEGYGLPLLEAARQEIPSICAPLPVFREILGDIPVYVEHSDLYRWRETIVRMMDKEEQRTERDRIKALVSRQGLPSWEAHFNAVLSAIG